MKTLVTGAAGFIGFHVSRRLLESGYEIVGLDNINGYYDINLKKDRLNILKDYKRFVFYKNNLEDKEAVEQLFGLGVCRTFRPENVKLAGSYKPLRR